jgi:hypothetical protein
MSTIQGNMPYTITPQIVDTCDRLWSLTSILEKIDINVSNYRNIISHLAFEYTNEKAFNLMIEMSGEIKNYNDDIYKHFIETQDEFIKEGFVNDIKEITLIV